MAVTAGYLAKLRRSVRRNTSVDVDAELTDIIEECRLDLQALGVLQIKTDDETDSLILGAVRCFVRWKFGLSNEDAELNRDDYMLMRDEIRRRRDYISYAITFSVKTGGVAVADAYITFNGETRQTGATGTAVFYYVAAGVNRGYTVYKTGYISQSADADVTASATINITLIAG
jgi:hypothetical protein